MSAPSVERHAYDRACRNTQHAGCTCMHPVNGRWCGKDRNDPIHDVDPAAHQAAPPEPDAQHAGEGE